MSARTHPTPVAVPPLENGDRLDIEEFRRRREAMPELKKAELIDGTVYIADPRIHAQIDPRIPPLENGDHLDYAEFARRWDNMPDLKKAELIDGVVYMPPPVSTGLHGMPHADLLLWLGFYTLQTPGTDHSTDGTIRLPGNNAPQADGCLLITRECGGSAWLDAEGYLHGIPELVAEVAASTVSYDLHQKFEIYRSAGIGEYLVHRTRDRSVDWFVLRGGTYQPLAAGADGVLKSPTFPGLWLDPAALARRDRVRVMAVLQAGLATPEHAAFVSRLAAARASNPQPPTP